MASDPSFAATINAGTPAVLGAAETSLTTPTTTSTIFTAGASGSQVDELVVAATATTVAGLVYVFRYNGTTYYLYDEIIVLAVASSTSVAPYRIRVPYPELLLPSGWSLRCSQSIAGNASVLVASAIGGDF